MIDLEAYRLKRKNFYSSIDGFWPDLYGKEYSLFGTYSIAHSEVLKINKITDRLGQIFTRMASYLRAADDATLLELGIPKEALMVIRINAIGIDSVIARLDLVKTSKGYKLLEINSDTPTFIVECFKVNGLVCNHFKVKNPNLHLEECLAQALRRAIIESAKSIHSMDPHVVFTAHADNIEDWNTVSYLKELSQFQSYLCPLDSLSINEEGIYDDRGKRIDVLYRQTYPLEHLVHDTDPECGEKIGIQLLRLVKNRKLAILNPPSAFLLQSKALQALIWGIAESGAGSKIFTSEELHWIHSYMLPTYLEADPFLNKKAFIRKPSFGREGDSIEIFNEQGKSQYKEKLQTYESELPVYQELADLPEAEIMTAQGPEKLKFLMGSFLIGGKASAIGIRAGRAVIDNDSYFLPVSLKKE
ncbi:glutathionylspermidine synthase family protein [Peribacillus deserti]|uniref:Glutathionylspermidine synthase n=1 Tax=Peribacillus deserti TaxID=673318 RepID=A0A2N5M739_9BACI|nr:glutathionylspermidine synthase family protein [Peribacillus deserti]PLT30170.1 glutathionylspermidine synthase [Peribacillus deserti]